jgi:hypothetical protein
MVNPLPHLLNGMLANGGQGLIALLPQRCGIQVAGGAEGLKQGLPLLFRSVSAGAGVKHLHQSQGEERIRLKAPLVTEKVEFHQQLIDQPPVEGADHVGEGSMEGSLAVGNSEKGAHASHGIKSQRP